jgi:hypothetical protein
MLLKAVEGPTDQPPCCSLSLQLLRRLAYLDELDMIAQAQDGLWPLRIDWPIHYTGVVYLPSTQRITTEATPS